MVNNMVILNSFWTLLARGATRVAWRKSGQAYASEFFSDSRHEIIAPSVEQEYSLACAEQILQVVLASKLSARVLAGDVLNTYTEPVAFPTESVIITSVGGDVMIANVVDEGCLGPWSVGHFELVIDPGAMTAAVKSALGTSSYTFTMTDGLSDKIPLAGSSYLRLSGTLPGVLFNVTVDQMRPFHRPLLDVLDALGSGKPWNKPELRSVFEDSFDPVDKIAAVAVDMCEGYGFGD